MSLLNVNKIAPQSGTALTLGDSGDTFTVPSGATLTVAGTFTQTGAQTFDGGVDIDNFNINGSEIDLSSGDLTVDVAGDIILDADGGEVLFHDATTAMGHISMASSNITLKSLVSDKDIIFQGNDGGAGITALTLDMSAAGAATFNNNVTVGDNLNMTTDSSVIAFGADSEITLTHSADSGLLLKHTATADDKPINLVLQTGETDMAANDVIGKISFQAPDEGTGTDAILVSGAIQAVAEGDHSSSSNATRLEFMTGASEAAAVKMAIASDGDVGIGTTSPLGQLHIKTGAQAGTPNVDADADELILESNGNCGLNILCPQGNVGSISFSDDGDADVGIIEYVHSGNSMRFTTGATEGMRLTGDDVTVSRANNFTNNGTGGGSGIRLSDVGGARGEMGIEKTGTAAAGMIYFYNGNGTVGAVVTEDSSTSYATSSDYRLKENQVAISDGITRLKTLKPYRFNFKTNADKTVDGFFAHEVTAVPEAISGTKDAVDADDKIISQGIDQSKLVPLLTAALKEAITKIETLETKVQALEDA